jgi:hypothetical protein
MPKTIIINSSNIVPSTNNSEFTYNFPNGGVVFRDDLIAIQQVSVFNSVFNITTASNNNTFSYTWVNGTTYNITIPDSYLDASGINAYMQSVMFSNKHYMTTATGSIVYFLEFVLNSARYAFQINCYLVSTALATTNGWSMPAASGWVTPTAAICPMFIVPATNIRDLIGFTAGSYPNTVIAGVPPAQTQTPAQTVSFSALSTTSPQIIPIPTYLMTCNLVQNKLAIPSQLLFSLTIENTPFGALYTTQISSPVFNEIADGQYTSMTVRFVDNQGNKILFNDPTTNILMIIKNRNEITN